MLGIESVKKFMEEGKARSSALVAEAVGGSVAQIAKNIVVETKGGDVFWVIISGDKRVDLSKVSKIVGADLKPASPENILKETGYVVDGVPPFEHKRRMRTFLDRSVERF